MKNTALRISLGQHSDKGIKPLNQDFHGGYVPADDLLSSKGIALAVADGISSSEVSHIASESAVSGFLADYYATTDAWSVKTAVERVLCATNAWLYAQTRQGRYDEQDQGYVCTLSALVLKGMSAHVFHIGDSRVYRIGSTDIEQLTEDHRVRVSSTRSYLARALGISHRLDLDYMTEVLSAGDVYVLATDGVYEFVSMAAFAERLRAPDADLSAIARDMVSTALTNGSDDNLTVQIVRIDALPALESSDILRQLDTLPCPPPLAPGMSIDGLRIIHEIRISSRSHTFLAENMADSSRVVLKVPSTGMRDDRAYLERFLIEDWVARRIDNAHVVKPCITSVPRSAIYVATEYLDGQSLSQWMRENPAPDLTMFRNIMKQIARGVQALHRQEMLHQDLKPENILIDDSGTVKIIDFGATRVAGLDETQLGLAQINLLGAAQYAAPEYFLGKMGEQSSDQFSLGVIAYQILTGRLPYGDAVPRARSAKTIQSLRYLSATQFNSDVPIWMDAAIKRAVDTDPEKRYPHISEFIHDLSHPNPCYLDFKPVPLIRRNPLRFWQLSTAFLALLVGVLAIKIGIGSK
jgi:serine/threonine protein phosphatase PrpC